MKTLVNFGGEGGITSATWTADSGDPGRGEARSVTPVPHCVRHFFSPSALTNKFATLPAKKNAPGFAGSTNVTDLRGVRDKLRTFWPTTY